MAHLRLCDVTRCHATADDVAVREKDRVRKNNAKIGGRRKICSVKFGQEG